MASDSRLASTFRSSGNGALEVYINVSDDGPKVKREVGYRQVTNFIEAGNQDQPTSRVAQLTPWPFTGEFRWLGTTSPPRPTTPPRGLSSAVRTVSTSLSGLNLHPEVAIHGSKVHVIWKNSGGDQVMYLRGTLEEYWVEESRAESGASLNTERTWCIEGALPGEFRCLDHLQVVLASGMMRQPGAADLPSQLAQSQVIVVQIQSRTGLDMLKLGMVRHYSNRGVGGSMVA